MEKSKKTGRLFTLLLKNYIFLTIVLISLISFSFFCLLQKMNHIVSEIDSSQIFNYEDQLSEQRYNELPLTQLFGENSGIVIYNDQYVKVYEKGNFQSISNLSIHDIACIPEYTSNTEITANDILTKDGNLQHSISIKEQVEKKDVIKTYILDNENNIIYQPGDLPFETLDSKQMKLLSNTYDKVYSIEKHTFNVRDGNLYTMIIYSNDLRPETQDILVQSILLFLVACLLFFGIITFIFINFLNKKIQMPLTTLLNEFDNFEKGKISNRDYKGPKEFVEIFDSFDSLSHRLNQSEKERLELEANRQKMLSDISHDLRTPISVIQGYTKALNDGVIPNEEQAKYLEMINKKAIDLNTLIDTFYEYSKMENPQYALKLVPIDICNFLRDYVADKYAELEIDGFLIEVNIPEVHVICDIDSMALKRAFDNIVNNSIKHNKTGITLTFSLFLNENNVAILLKDNGIGIPKELQSTIFSPFVVGEISRNKQGSGLGLAITKKVIEAHHGTIKLLDMKEGTAFEIILPIK